MADRALLIAGLVLMGLAIVGTLVLLAPAMTPAPRSDTGSDATLAALSGRLPVGEVATAVRLDAVGGVGGAIRAGDAIDLYAHFPTQAGAAQPSTRLLLRDALVYVAAKDPNALTVTLAMPPERAVLIQQALRQGARPFAAVRSPRTGSSAGEGFDDSDLAAWLTRVAAGR